MSRVYIIVDIDLQHSSYQRCVDFVTATSIKYGLSSKFLSELGGSERARLPELYENDYEWSAKGKMQTSPPTHDRIEILLYDDVAPTCAQNFIALCTGEKGRSKGGGGFLHFKNTPFHRLVPGQFMQGGDFSHGNGAGGESIWGGVFKDDKAALTKKFDKRGLLAMSNTGKNTNGSQFFFALAPLPKLNGKHCVFGEVTSGFEVLALMEGVGESGEVPNLKLSIMDCGRM